MFVGPPEALKTACLKVLTGYPNALPLTDINTQQLTKLRDAIAAGIIKTLALLDLQKLYERDPQTALNAEGNIRALACEGFTAASFQSQEVNRMTARCVVMAAMTNALMEHNFERWNKTGFARRFLFSMFALADPDVLVDAILKWEKLPLSFNFITPPASRSIPFTVTVAERQELQKFVRFQYGKTEPLHMLCKIYAVLKWHYNRDKAKKQKLESDRAMTVIADFGESLGREGTRLTL